MADTAPWSETRPTALLVLADGTVVEGQGIGATGSAVAELCFNTALTGYQEILTDPSYAGQIVTFTFPHIGNVGTNDEDLEDLTPAARAGAVGAVFKADVTNPSSYRASAGLDAWLKRRGVIAIAGVDTRALASLIRDKGMPNAVIAHAPDGRFDVEDLEGQGCAVVRPGRARSGPRGDLAARARPGARPMGLGRGLRRPGRAFDACCRGRLWRQAQHPAAAGGARRRGDGGAGHHHCGGHPGHEAGRRLPVQRPWRPGGDRRLCGAGDPRPPEDRHPGVRHLPRPPDAGAGASAPRP